MSKANALLLYLTVVFYPNNYLYIRKVIYLLNEKYRKICILIKNESMKNK